MLQRYYFEISDLVGTKELATEQFDYGLRLSSAECPYYKLQRTLKNYKITDSAGGGQIRRFRGFRFMALEGKFLVEVQKYVSELTKQKEALILDAATGAGETTLQIAKAMRGGKLITVDSDIASWEEWTKSALKNMLVV